MAYFTIVRYFFAQQPMDKNNDGCLYCQPQKIRGARLNLSLSHKTLQLNLRLMEKEVQFLMGDALPYVLRIRMIGIMECINNVRIGLSKYVVHPNNMG